MFDTHNHLLDTRFSDDISEVLSRIQNSGMYSLSCATNYDESVRLMEFIEDKDFLYGAIGLHPQEVTREEYREDKYRSLLSSQTSSIVAIGEIGLDYYWPEFRDTKEQQKEVLRSQLALAQEFNLPVIIHCRDTKEFEYGCFDDLFQILEEFSRVKGVVHSFTGTLEHAQKIQKLGYYIGINGIITFKNAGHLIDVVKSVPLDRILIETDSPYLAPTPHRGKRNEPVYVEFIAQKIADIYQMSKDKLLDQTTENAKKLFQIK